MISGRPSKHFDVYLDLREYNIRLVELDAAYEQVGNLIGA